MTTFTNPFPGKKIDFEGINASGKSTQHRLACEHYAGAIGTKEPYTKRADGVAVDSGVAIYDILNGRHPIITLAELGLIGFQVEHFFPNRLEHFEDIVIPHLKEGRHVFSDRGPASMCFGAAEPYNLLELMDRQREVFDDARLPLAWADAILIFDITPEESVQRLAKRSGKPDGHEDLATQARVRMNYKRFAELYPHCYIIDGSGTPDEVFKRTCRILDPILR